VSEDDIPPTGYKLRDIGNDHGVEYTLEYKGRLLRYDSLGDYIIDRMYMDGHPPPVLVKIECADHRELCARVFDVPRVGAFLRGHQLPRHGMSEGRDLWVADVKPADEEWEWVRYTAVTLLELEGEDRKYVGPMVFACVRHQHDICTTFEVIRRAVATGRQRRRAVTIIGKRSALQ
jgi:hypothetical protein